MVCTGSVWDDANMMILGNARWKNWITSLVFRLGDTLLIMRLPGFRGQSSGISSSKKRLI